MMATNDENKGTQLTSFVPKDLIDQGFKYVFEVPIYQRVFTWGETEFERLISDLVKAFQNGDSKEDYYLGAITVVRKEKASNTLVLVDGQQRVTCIMLLGALFKWWGADQIRIKYESRPKDMECLRRIYAEFSKVNAEDAEVDVGNIDTSKFENRAMRAFFDYIKRGDTDLQLDAIIKKNIDSFLKFGDKIKDRLRLLVSYLPDNPYMANLQAQNEYFEKMNSGGKQLEPEDILKVRICGKLGEKAFEEWNAISDFSRCYGANCNFVNNDNATNTEQGHGRQAECQCTLLTVVSSIDNAETLERFGIGKKDLQEPDEVEERIPVRQGLIDFSMFLRHVLYIKKGNDKDKVGSLLDAFAECENWDENSCKTFLDKMQLYRKFLDDSVIHLKDEGGANGYYFYNSENGDSKSLIAKDESGQEGDGDSHRILQLQSLLFVTSDERQEWLLKLYEKMIGAQHVDIFSAVKMCLSDQLQGDVFDLILSNTKTWPNSAKTEDTVGHGDVLKYGSKAVRLWLAFLDYLLWDLASKDCQDDKQDDLCEDGKIFKDIDKATMNAVKSYVFRRNRSVEHLHPQTDSNSAHQEKWNEAWGGNGRTIKDFFGNLALISAGRNSEYSNESVGGKADRVRRLVENKSIESIKLLLMLKNCDGKDEKWTPECALNHANGMLSVFKMGIGKFQSEGRKNKMIVQVFEMYSDDCDCNDYEEEEVIRVGKDAVSASYVILDDPDQDPEESERRGELSPGGEYVFRKGRMMGRVDGRWVDWEAEEF